MPVPRLSESPKQVLLPSFYFGLPTKYIGEVLYNISDLNKNILMWWKVLQKIYFKTFADYW